MGEKKPCDHDFFDISNYLRLLQFWKNKFSCLAGIPDYTKNEAIVDRKKKNRDPKKKVRKTGKL